MWSPSTAAFMQRLLMRIYLISSVLLIFLVVVYNYKAGHWETQEFTLFYIQLKYDEDKNQLLTTL